MAKSHDVKKDAKKTPAKTLKEKRVSEEREEGFEVLTDLSSSLSLLAFRPCLPTLSARNRREKAQDVAVVQDAVLLGCMPFTMTIFGASSGSPNPSTTSPDGRLPVQHLNEREATASCRQVTRGRWQKGAPRSSPLSWPHLYRSLYRCTLPVELFGRASINSIHLGT